MVFTWLHMRTAEDLRGGTNAQARPGSLVPESPGMERDWKWVPVTRGPHVHPGNAGQGGMLYLLGICQLSEQPSWDRQQRCRDVKDHRMLEETQPTCSLKPAATGLKGDRLTQARGAVA